MAHLSKIEETLAIALISTILVGFTPVPRTGPVVQSTAGGPGQPPRRVKPTPKPIPELQKPTRLWKPGSTIKVLIEKPNTGNGADDLLFISVVTAQFEGSDEYQRDVWGTNGLKFVFVSPPPFPPNPPPPAPAADIVIKWVDHLPNNPVTGEPQVGIAVNTGVKGRPIKNQNGGNTNVDTYTQTTVEITLAKKSPGTNTLRPAGALGRTIQHEIGHAEGLDHAATGVMAAKGTGEQTDQPIDLSQDALVKQAKSAIQAPGRQLPPVPPVPIGHLDIGPNVFFSPPRGLFEFDYRVSSDPLGNSSFVQFAAYLGIEPQEARVPPGWEVDFARSEPTGDFVLNGEFFGDPTGIGWLRFFTDDASFAIDPGESLTFGFMSPLGPNDVAFRQVYGVTTAGDAQFLLVTPEPRSTYLMISVLVILIPFLFRQRRLEPSP